jgi:hypothetical protein
MQLQALQNSAFASRNNANAPFTAPDISAQTGATERGIKNTEFVAGDGIYGLLLNSYFYYSFPS